MGRIKVIETIQSIPDQLFSDSNIELQKAILISKIIVLNDLIKDF